MMNIWQQHFVNKKYFLSTAKLREAVFVELALQQLHIVYYYFHFN